MSDRLKWEPDRQGGLRANFEDGYATIIHDTSTNGWRWAVAIGEAKASNISSTKQNASNASNDALPGVRTVAAQLKSAEAHKAAVLAKIDQATTEADPDVASIFSIATASREHLSWIIEQVRHRTRTPGLEKLIDSVSRELYKFRTGERC